MLRSQVIFLIPLIGLLLSCAPTPRITLPRYVETKLQNIPLGNINHAETQLGFPIKINDHYTNQPMASFYNHDGSEMLSLAFSTESDAGLFHYYYVSKVNKAVFPYPRLKTVTTFTTGKGIHTGMNQAELKTRLGEPHKITKHEMDEDYEEVKWQFFFTDTTKTLFPHPFKNATYQSTYTFWNDELTQFSFGFKPTSTETH